MDFVWNYQTNVRRPDGLNGTLAVLPGTGTVLGAPDLEGQNSPSFSGSIGLRSVLTTNLTNEFTGGVQGGTATLGSGLSLADYGLFNGYQIGFGLPALTTSTTPTGTAGTATGAYISNPYLGSYTGFAPRNAPVKQFNDNVTWQKGNHLINFGGNFTQVGYWQAAGNTSLLQAVFFGQAVGDPDNTGATSLFTSSTLPGSTPQQQADAANLYAVLVGRIAQITSSAVLNEQTKTYGRNYTIDRDRQREFGIYAQDAWHPVRISP